MLDMIDVAKRAYAAYGRSTGNKNFRGEEMPTWDALPQAIRDAWVAAVTEVVEFVSASA
jgi:hypothetical protein